MSTIPSIWKQNRLRAKQASSATHAAVVAIPLSAVRTGKWFLGLAAVAGGVGGVTYPGDSLEPKNVSEK